MAIDRMKHATLLVPRRQANSLLDWLQEREVFHVEDASEETEGAEELERPAHSTEEVDTRIHELRHALQVFDDFDVAESSLADMVVELPTQVSRRDRERILREFDYRPVYEECAEAATEYHEHQEAIREAEAEISNLEFFEALPFTPDEVRALERTRVWVGTMPAKEFDSLRENPEEWRIVSVQDLRRRDRDVDVAAVSLKEEAEEAGRILRGHSFSEMQLPDLDASIGERLNELRVRVHEHEKKAQKCRRRIVDMSAHQYEVEVVLGYWEAERDKIEARNKSLNSDRISIVSGFVREKDEAALENGIQQDFPSVGTVYRAPMPQEDVPVSLSHSALVKPVRVLVDMFGVPDYFGFDPTAFLALSFLVFFGMCFADVVYGVVLAALCFGLARKSRGYEGLQNLLLLFAYCGVSTAFFGVLAGSYAADLPARIFGEESQVVETLQGVAIISPLDKAVQLLLVTLAIGVINQMYAMILKGYGLVRRGRPLDALLDAGLWLVMIPCFLIIIAPMFVELPSGVHRIGTTVGLITAVLLVLTQGRKQESFVGKAAIGLVSLYGVMGSYGCVSFISDMLSYSRLLALGLATTVIGMSLNIVAEMLNVGGVFGIALFALVVILGHSVNFGLGMIGAFVHPLRLIFVEFFGRFYESGSGPFRPLSLNTDHVLVKE